MQRARAGGNCSRPAPFSLVGGYSRPEKPLPEQFAPFCRAWRAGRISGAAAARALGMPLSSFRYRAFRYRAFRYRAFRWQD